MQAVRFDDVDALARIAARGFGNWGDSLTIDRDIVDAFEPITGPSADDRHLSIWLLQSILPRVQPDNDWEISGYSGALNLGCPEIRLPVPAAVGSSVRSRSRLAYAKLHPKGMLLAMEFEVQEEGADTPCLRSMLEILYLGGAS